MSCIVYTKHIVRNVFSVIEQTDSSIKFTTTDKRFISECGGHRFQRIPPTEKNGRVHTSTVTVACIEQQEQYNSFNESKIIVEYYRSSGPGGQNKNKVETACRLKYDNIIVTCSDERSKLQNYNKALVELKRRVAEHDKNTHHRKVNEVRKSQVGCGQRGDKIRTYREQDNIIIDHKSGNKFNFLKLSNKNLLDLIYGN